MIKPVRVIALAILATSHLRTRALDLNNENVCFPMPARVGGQTWRLTIVRYATETGDRVIGSP